MDLPITIRPGKPEDSSFIFSTWLKGQYFGNDWFESVDQKVYFAYYSKYVEAILAKSNVSIACLTDDPDVILGYAVYTLPETLHWVFVKGAWRAKGIARRLVPEAITTITGLTKPGKAIMIKKGLRFNPWLS